MNGVENSRCGANLCCARCEGGLKKETRRLSTTQRTVKLFAAPVEMTYLFWVGGVGPGRSDAFVLLKLRIGRIAASFGERAVTSCGPVVT